MLLTCADALRERDKETGRERDSVRGEEERGMIFGQADKQKMDGTQQQDGVGRIRLCVCVS